MDRKKALVLTVTALVLLGALWHFPSVNAASNPIALDGTAQSGLATFQVCDTAGGGSLSTTKSPDILLAFVAINDTVSTVSNLANDAGFYLGSGSINWVVRGSVSLSSTLQVIEYYAVVQRPVNGLNVKFTISGLKHLSFGAICLLLALSGIDPINPFDSNPVLPGSNSGTSGTESGTFSTTANLDMMLFIEGDCSSFPGTQGTPTGWTQLGQSTQSQGSSNNCSNETSGNIALTVYGLQTQNSRQVNTFTNSLFGSAPWVTMPDAVTVPRQGSSGSGCGTFPGGICNPNPVGFQFQSSLICPTGNGTLSIGCYALPSQLTNPLVPYVGIGLAVGVLASTFIGRDYTESRDKRRSLV